MKNLSYKIHESLYVSLDGCLWSDLGKCLNSRAFLKTRIWLDFTTSIGPSMASHSIKDAFE